MSCGAILRDFAIIGNGEIGNAFGKSPQCQDFPELLRHQVQAHWRASDRQRPRSNRFIISYAKPRPFERLHTVRSQRNGFVEISNSEIELASFDIAATTIFISLTNHWSIRLTGRDGAAATRDHLFGRHILNWRFSACIATARWVGLSSVRMRSTAKFQSQVFEPKQISSRKLSLHGVTPYPAYLSAIFGSITFAAAMSAFPPAVSPDFRFARPRM